MALVQDPEFWRRFSRAIHLDEEAKGPSESAETVVYSYAASSLGSPSEYFHLYTVVQLANASLVADTTGSDVNGIRNERPVSVASWLPFSCVSSSLLPRW